MDGESHPRAEEALRLLASAANAVRLYPPSSALPAQAAAKFAARSNDIASAMGPLRYVVDPHGFRIGDEGVAIGFSQTVQLAESLHALQVGQLIIAPGLSEREATAFVEAILADPMQVRREGGLRAHLVSAGIEHIAVIEVSLRASSEDGLLGLDLATAPLEEIAREAVNAAENWARTAATGEGRDDMTEAAGRLEQATRDIALARVADALMRVDEHTRMKVLAWSLKADASGQRMNGMLQVLARMKPAALARLLMIVAAQAGTEPGRIARAMDLPPEVARELQILLAPSPRSEAECGIPTSVDHSALAVQARPDDDRSRIERQIAIAAPSLAAGKALSAGVAVSHTHPDEETVKAIATALPQAARDGAFTPTRVALRRLDELANDPALTESVSAARASLADPKVLVDVCRAPMGDADAAIAGEILTAAGVTGAEVLVNFYDRADDARRSLMRPVLRSMGDPILGVANRRLRGNDPLASVIVLRTLPALGDHRVVPTLTQALQDVHTEVRLAAVRALADTPCGESRQALAKALNHWDPETQRLVVREIGRVRAVEAVPPMLRALEDINIFRLNYELKKEIVRSLAQVGSPEALPALKRVSRGVALRRKTKELRLLAKRAMLSIRQQNEMSEDSAVPASPSAPSTSPTANHVPLLTQPENLKQARQSEPQPQRMQDTPQSERQPVGAATGGVDDRA